MAARPAVKPLAPKHLPAVTPGVGGPQPVVQMPKQPSFSPLVLALLVVASCLSVLLGLVFINRSQDLRQQAVDTSTPVLLSFKSRSQDSRLLIDVVLNSRNYAIAGVELKGTLTGVNREQVTVNTSNPLHLDAISSALSVGATATSTDFAVTLFAPLDPTLPSNTHDTEVVITSFEIANPPTGDVGISFSTGTKVPTIEPATITVQLASAQTFSYIAIGGASPSPTAASSPSSDANKKTCNQNCATDTECQSIYQCYKGECRLKGDLEDSQCQGPADQGLNRGCNQYCADSRECQNQFTCYFNQCRNPRNLTNTSCENPRVTTTTSTPRSTATPRTSTRPSPSPSARLVAARLVSPSPTASPRATASASASASPRVSASPSPFTSQRPTVRTPEPSPATTRTSSSNRSRMIIGILAILIGGSVLGFIAFKFLTRS